MVKPDLEVWGYNTYRPFRIYWILHEYGLKYIAHRIGSRTGETQTKEYLEMNAKGNDLKPGRLIASLGDCHLYNNHLEQAELQLTRQPRKLPRLKILNKHNDIFSYQITDFELVDYDPYNHIKASVSV